MTRDVAIFAPIFVLKLNIGQRSQIGTLLKKVHTIQ
jgi:hypothetical protein